MADLSKLLEQMIPDEEKLYLLKNRDLITEDNFTVLQNDNGSTRIKIIMPMTIGGKSFRVTDEQEHFVPDAPIPDKFYIDYIDGSGKPGTVANDDYIVKNVYKQIYDSENNIYNFIEQTWEYEPPAGREAIVVNNTTIKLEEVENNTFIIDNELYVIENNTKYSRDGKTYDSLIKNENFEDSAEISLDYPSRYADVIYFIKESPNLTVTTQHAQNNLEYMTFEWTLDKQVTNAVGEITFSIRIEGNDFIYQSNPASFKVVSNLKETYYLKKEVEENYVIQGREIKPVGNFKNVLVKGDTNSNKIFYKMNRYFQGQDILAKRSFTKNIGTEQEPEYENYEVYKNTNGVFAYKDGNTYKVLNVNYVVNDLSIYNDNDTTGSYDTIRQIITVDDKDYHIDSLVRTIVATASPMKYDFTLTLEELDDNKQSYNPSRTTSYHLPELSGIITINNISYQINIEALGNAFEDTEITIDEYMVPVFNRLIRFNFMSPNKDYGDWNNGEIEYISELNDNDEQYFIFSWTPDARVTRVAGDVGYYIEFYINGSYEEMLEGGETTVIRSKSYSWSTLPSTIRVEQNEAATASADYLPHWVSYLENNLQDDMDSFLNNDLQSQYNALEDYLLYTLLGDYAQETSVQENYKDGTEHIEIGEIDYIITKSQKDNRFDFVLNNEDNQLLFTFKANLIDSSIYAAAAQIIEDPTVEVSKLFLQSSGEEIEFEVETVKGQKTITITINGNDYTTNYPTSFVSTLSFTELIVCDVEYNPLLNNYFMVYNDTTKLLKAYRLSNEDGVSVPFLTYAQSQLDSWVSNAEGQRTNQQNEFTDLVNEVINTFGMSSEFTDSLYTRIWDFFTQLAAELHYAYNGTGTSSFTIYTKEGGNTQEIPSVYENDLLTFTYNSTIYYCKYITDIDNKTWLNISTDNKTLYSYNKYYLNEIESIELQGQKYSFVINGDSIIVDINNVIYTAQVPAVPQDSLVFSDGQSHNLAFNLIYKKAVDRYNLNISYYNRIENNGQISYEVIAFQLLNVYGDNDGTYPDTLIDGVSCRVVSNSLYTEIDARIDYANSQLANDVQDKQNELETKCDSAIEGLENKNSESLQKYTIAASESLENLQTVYAAIGNSELLQTISELESTLQDLSNQKTATVNVRYSNGTLIIAPSQTNS